MSKRKKDLENMNNDINEEIEKEYISEVQKQIESLENSPLSDESEIDKLITSDAVKKHVISNLSDQLGDQGEVLDIVKDQEFTLQEYLKRFREHKKLFEHALIVQADESEIIIAMGIPIEMLHRICILEYGQSFDKVRNKFHNIGRIMLRYSQMKLADRYPVMATWLGRQYLGQKERQENQSTIRTDKQIVERVKEILSIGGEDE